MKWQRLHKIKVKSDTYVLHSVSIVLLIEVVIKRSHVRLFEIGLEKKKKGLEVSKLCLNLKTERHKEIQIKPSLVMRINQMKRIR